MKIDKNTLFYGDNLDILRHYIEDETIDLIYIDPPFKKQKQFNILYKEPNGTLSEAQTIAYADAWFWDEVSERYYKEIVKTAPESLADTIIGLRKFLNESDMMAYLVNMTVRIVELHRVLKPTGSLYLHCDWSAAHYLKILLDAIFGEENFRNEIIWGYRTGGVSKRHFARKHDSIFLYTKTDNYIFNPKQERIYYEKDFFGVKKDTEGRFYADVYIRDVWDGVIKPVINVSKDRLGYPTQKPVELIERIIEISSNKDDWVLDAFCGCGTTVAAAENLNRKWVGIDITHLAVSLMKYRLRNSFILEAHKDYDVIGEPVDLHGAVELAKEDKYKFQYWALGLINAGPLGHTLKGKKGADRGIDGFLYFIDTPSKEPKKVIIQVKGGNVGVSQIRDLKGTVEREKAAIGLFITLEVPSKQMIKEAAASGFYYSKYLNKDYPKIQILTIGELLKGKKPEYPFVDIPAHDITFKKAPKVKEVEQLKMN